jgi:hypothetical protein
MAIIEMDDETFHAALWEWNKTQDRAEREAGELVLVDLHWSNSRDFREKCTNVYEDIVYIDWAATDNALRNNQLLGSSGEIAFLKWAVLIARDPFGASSLDRVNRTAVVLALAEAWGVDL